MSKRTIEELTDLPGRVYVYLEDEEAAEEFFARAQEEGFLFGDGKRPSEKPRDCIIALNKDRTLNYVGFAGHAVFGSGTKTVGGQPLIRVDLRRYISGEDDYICQRRHDFAQQKAAG